MDIRIQECQQCQSPDLENILVREPGRVMSVFVRCQHCRQLVAHYRLNRYYHHGKGIDSFLRGAGLSEEESGREILERFNEAKQTALDGFTRVTEEMNEIPPLQSSSEGEDQ